MQKVSQEVASTLKQMINFAKAGITTKALDDFGAAILKQFGANSAPHKTYKFPGYTCISIDNEFCHGIPSVKISDIGHLIETEAKKRGFKVIKNLTGHGVGRALHEEPHEIANYKDPFNTARFKKKSVVAIETFISTTSTYAQTLNDGWTMVGNKGGFMAQHEHTIVITDGKPIILTEMNEIWN